MSRLFVIPARDVHAAIVVRRGPSEWSHLILWDTHRDTFTHGAWMKGRISPEKCDLSPDGELFLYFVHQGSRLQTSYTDSWTALSRAPWLHALVLWPQGTTYGGGGRFIGNRAAVLRGVSNKPHPEHPLRGVTISDGAAELHRASNDVPGSDWCGRDKAGRIIHSKGDQLFGRSGTEDALLADFSALEPDPQPPPDSAKRAL